MFVIKTEFAIRNSRIANIWKSFYIYLMRKHTGMRPHDIPILIKVYLERDKAWLMKDISASLYISPSEVSESLNRSWYAGLIDADKVRVQAQNFYEFLIHGVRYVFPQQPGPLVRGIPTAHSHPQVKEKFISDIKYVWASSMAGKDIGQAIDPFYPKQVDAVLQDEQLYLILSLIDMIRVGKTREVKYAKEQLLKIFRIDP